MTDFILPLFSLLMGEIGIASIILKKKRKKKGREKLESNFGSIFVSEIIATRVLRRPKQKSLWWRLIRKVNVIFDNNTRNNYNVYYLKQHSR